MNKAHLFALASALIAAPLAYAHTDGGVYGTPKTYCEDVKGDFSVHEYAAAEGSVLYGAGDVNVNPQGLFDILTASSPLPPVYGHTPFIGKTGDGSVPPCPYDPQWDGHYEFAFGGAFLLACETGCTNPYSGQTGDGTLVCWETYADHAGHTSIHAWDHALGTLGLPVQFNVGADYWDNVPNVDPTEPACGDFETEIVDLCTDYCILPHSPGLDGTYTVFVCGPSTQGHVWTGSFPAPPPKVKNSGCPL